MSFYQGPANSVLHPTDFSAASETAFAHALAISLANKADLTILHVVRDEDTAVRWHDFPSVRRTLEKWGKLEPGSHRKDVGEKLGIYVNKRVGVDSNVVDSIVELTEEDSFDLLVMGTHENHHHSIWSKPSISIPVAQRTHLPTLFVPDGVEGCVDMGSGQTNLKRILIAVDHEPSAQPAIARIATMVHNLGGEAAEVTLLHVGRENKFPLVDPPMDSGMSWSTVTRHGTASTEIVQHAQEIDADVIVMVTSGKKHLWDALVGSTVQNVVKKAPCLVFAMPA
jgi:nucleotide-binding universal stress UspA family protein